MIENNFPKRQFFKWQKKPVSNRLDLFGGGQSRPKAVQCLSGLRAKVLAVTKTSAILTPINYEKDWWHKHPACAVIDKSRDLP
jgi:hypothetical protein